MIEKQVRLNVFIAKHSLNFCKRSLSTVTTEVESGKYCLDLVKKHDYENFMCLLLLKGHPRSISFAIRAFNVEVARVAEQVTQPNIGLMRLKFWEETIDKCFQKDFAKVPQHPVAVELFKAAHSVKLTKRYFQNLVACRSEYMSRTGFIRLDDLENYAEKSVSNVYYLMLEACDVRNVHADHAASHLGKAQGIIQQLRGVPVAKQINFIAIPQEVLAKHKVSQEEILRGKLSKNLEECTFEVASRAHIHLIKARNLLKNVPKDGRQVLLPATLVDNYLYRLQQVNHDVFNDTLKHRAWNWLPKLYINSLRNVY